MCKPPRRSRLRGNNPLSSTLCTSSRMCQTYVSYLIKADHCDWSVGSILGSGTLAAGQSHTSVLTVHISVQCNYRIHTPQLTQTKSEFKWLSGSTVPGQFSGPVSGAPVSPPPPPPLVWRGLGARGRRHRQLLVNWEDNSISEKKDSK